mgnify:CR=1 FL=1
MGNALVVGVVEKIGKCIIRDSENDKNDMIKTLHMLISQACNKHGT